MPSRRRALRMAMAMLRIYSVLRFQPQKYAATNLKRWKHNSARLLQALRITQTVLQGCKPHQTTGHIHSLMMHRSPCSRQSSDIGDICLSTPQTFSSVTRPGLGARGRLAAGLRGCGGARGRWQRWGPLLIRSSVYHIPIRGLTGRQVSQHRPQPRHAQGQTMPSTILGAPTQTAETQNRAPGTCWATVST